MQVKDSSTDYDWPVTSQITQTETAIMTDMHVQTEEVEEEAKKDTETATMIDTHVQTEVETSLSQIKLEEELSVRKQKSEDADMAYQSQIAQFMEHIKQERHEQACLRTSLMDSVKDNKDLR